MHLKDSILKTIAFYDLFAFPLSAEEIKERLYQYDKPVHIKEIKGILGQLVEAQALETLKELYVIKGRSEIVGTRQARKFVSEKFWNRVKLYTKYLQAVPFVRMVAVCNNLAYDNAGEQSDIDLFIVIESGRLWMTRLLITLILHFFGVRRHGRHVAGRFCLSFFITPERLNIGTLQLQPEDPYLAYWTQNLTPIYGEELYEQFKAVNQGWLKEKYGLSFLESGKRHLYSLKESRLKRFFEWLLKGRLGDLKEGFIKKILKKRSLARKSQLGDASGVIIEDTILKFHNEDRREEYRKKWMASLPTLRPESENKE